MRRSPVFVFACLFLIGPAEGNAAEPLNFNRDIRPILADKCFLCHGPDAKDLKGGLRIDLRDAVTAPADSGEVAIVPGDPDTSELIRRIITDDEDLRMPPAETRKTVSPEELALLRRWISEDAEYQDHWAFIAPKRPEAPAADGNWTRNDIDRFVLQGLKTKGLAPSAEASRETLIRRVSLDLRGFPPAVEEVDAFLNDSSEDAYENMVDRMLASPHFGEKMARLWMDLARYGDTNGFHYDSTRQVWLWRDWVINAYNDNMPFDQFTVEQLAGDLLPDATVSQKIASGFNRNCRYNEEGGADPEEWRVEYAKDRVRTLGQVWLGMTLNCADCHSHKYDPVSQTEFYELYAFFNSLDEPGAQGHRQKYPPLIEVPTSEQIEKIADLEDEIKALEQEISDELARIEYVEPDDVPAEPESKPVDVVWIDDATPEGASLQGNGQADGKPAWQWISKDDGPVRSGERSTKRTGTGLNQHFFTGAKEPLEISEGDVLFAWVWLDPENPPKTVQLQFNDGSWEHRAFWGEAKAFGGSKEGPARHKVSDKLPKHGEWVRLEVSAKDVGLKAGAKLNGWAFTQFDGTVYYDHAGVTRMEPDTRYLRSLAVWEEKARNDKAVPDAVRKALAVKPDKRNDGQAKTIRDYYVEHVFGETREFFDPIHKRLDVVRKDLTRTKDEVPFQLVSVELPEPRQAFMLVRGAFNQPGEKVERDVPDFLPGLPEDAPRNRLGLAKWLVSDEHPLTARVTVNRYWAQLFGRGIVETIGDFGQLGRFPTHPKLLDWLAVEFVESGWDTKHIMKLMVMSAAYRQSSVNDHRHDEADPKNLLLWRAPRFRLPAEEIRDSALKIAGLLSPTVGGPPVFPYQPDKYYEGKKGGWAWNVSKDDDRFRRGMYTFWRRTTPYPTFVIFDAPDRSECVVSRARTNTPQQALVTMNDPQFVEAARVFAQNVLKEGPSATHERLTFAFRRAVSRMPGSNEAQVLQELLDEELAWYREHPEAATSLASAGQYAKPEGVDSAEHAAWTAVANALLNLDETINRE
jgi:hypothetical protein